MSSELICFYAGAPFVLDRFTPAPTDDCDGTHLLTPHATILHVHRVLNPVSAGQPLLLQDDGVVGYVARGRKTPGGNSAVAIFMTIHDA